MGRLVFIDRDGTICKEHFGTYIGDWSMFEFLPGVKEAFRLLKKEGFKVFVISNQAGINKGVITKQQLNDVTEKMVAEIRNSGGVIDDVVYCPHRIEERCGCRKPAPGLILKLAEKHGVEPKNGWVVGDLIMDVEAGKAAGCRTVILRSGRPKTEEEWQQLKTECPPDYIAEDLLDAVKFIIGEER